MESILLEVPSKFQSAKEKVSKNLLRYREQEGYLQDSLKTRLNALRVSIEEIDGEVAGGRRLEQIDALEEWLDSGGDIPRCDELFPLVVDYVRGISNARLSLRVHIHRLASHLDRAGEHSTASRIRDAYGGLGGLLDASHTVADGAVFVGFRRHAKSAEAVPLRMIFQQVDGGQLYGKVEKSWMYRGHPVHQMTGRLNGALLSAQTGRTLAFGNKVDGLWRYDAYVIGRTIIGEFSGVDKKRRIGGGYFRLDKRGH